MRQKFGLILLSIFTMTIILGAAPPPDTPPLNPAFLHLQYATFDPLQAEPAIPENLKMPRMAQNLPTSFIVQFNGIIQDEWKTQLANLGGQIEGYLPDNAFLVRLTPNTADAISQIDGVRWVGPFQPAYKLSPRLSPDTLNIRIALASWADTATVKDTLVALGIDARGEDGVLIAPAIEAQFAAIAQLPDVLWVEPFSIPHIMNDKATGIMNVTTAWNLGYNGAGQIVTIADTGIDTGVDNPSVNGDIHLDFDNRLSYISSWPVQNYTGVTNVGADDGADDVNSGHGTHVSGSVTGNGARSSGSIRGVAYEADITFQAVEQYTTFTSGSPQYGLTGIPSTLSNLFQESYDWGARIHTNSWGSDDAGAYTSDSRYIDDFIWDNPDFTILFAAGNAGTDGNSNGYVDEGSVGSPATAKNAITIGASENVRASGGYNPGGPCSTYGGCWGSDYSIPPTSSDPLSNSAEEMAAFSSRGPTADGRIKPDLVAPGTNILSTRSSQTTASGWGAYGSYYMYDGGTSMATPLAAGAATVVRGYLVDAGRLANPSAAIVKAVLINTAMDISGYGNSAQEAGQPIPNNHEGWGRINVAAAISDTNRAYYDSASLTTGNSDTYTFTVAGTVDAFKTTLVWSDYPGSTSATSQLVNDLNLVVITPNGTTAYKGNVFSAGWSTTGGTADIVNNVENVYVQNPISGTWTILVSGASVPQGPQPYALVISQEKDSNPFVAQTPPDRQLASTFTYNQAVDLWNYLSDIEDMGFDVTYSIINFPDANVGASIFDGHYINFNPTNNWTGTTQVQVQVRDTAGQTANTSFNVTVIDPINIYLPLILKNAGNSPTMPFGTITDQGSPVVGTTVLLRYYNGSTWSTYTSTTTDSNGDYQFSSVPTLVGSQTYYVRWQNSADNSRLSSWVCDSIASNTPTSADLQCDFDVQNINLLSPSPSASVSLPQTFSWQRRTSTSDDYELNILDVFDNDPWWYTNPSLGYNGSYTLSTLPSGFSTFTQYGWVVSVYGSNGYGTSFYYRSITFNNTGRVIEGEQPASLSPKRGDFEQPRHPQ